MTVFAGTGTGLGFGTVLLEMAALSAVVAPVSMKLLKDFKQKKIKNIASNLLHDTR